MIDDSVPPSNLDAGLDAEAQVPKSVTLTPDQLASLNVGDLVPGQTLSLELKYTGDGAPDSAPPPAPGDDGGDTAQVEGGKAFRVVSSTTTTPPESDEDVPPEDMPGPDDDSSPEEKVLGFKRPSKPARSGLPDPRKMRE